MGRTVAFLARLVKDGWTTEGRSIAADRETALHVDRRLAWPRCSALPHMRRPSSIS